MRKKSKHNFFTCKKLCVPTHKKLHVYVTMREKSLQNFFKHNYA